MVNKIQTHLPNECIRNVNVNVYDYIRLDRIKNDYQVSIRGKHLG